MKTIFAIILATIKLLVAIPQSFASSWEEAEKEAARDKRVKENDPLSWEVTIREFAPGGVVVMHRETLPVWSYSEEDKRASIREYFGKEPIGSGPYSITRGGKIVVID